MTTHKEALEAAYLAGFNASGEGYNGEYPFGDHKQDPTENSGWKKDRDDYIKEALAQPEQEPVAWMCHPFGDDECEFSNHQECENCIPLYTAPPQRKPWVSLSDEDIERIAKKARSKDHAITLAMRELKEKNT